MEECCECGKEMIKGYQGYCRTCYGKIWDSGFDSTSDHAYKIGFDELARELGRPCTDDVRKAIKDILSDWPDLEWRCAKCDAVWSAKGGMTELEKLCGDCPDCGAGYAKPTPPIS